MDRCILKEFLGIGIHFEENVSLADYSTFRIGGKCPLALFPQSAEELKICVEALNLRRIRYRVIGRGSNILFSDKGFCGALIFTKKMCRVHSVGECGIYAEAGATLECISALAKKRTLTGAEFMHGIPGSCGGAVVMNAGAYGGEVSAVLRYTDCYDADKNEFFRLDNDGNHFSYRHSIFAERDSFVVIGACFEFSKGDAATIEEKMKSNMVSRKMKQPLEYPNAGSVFKRPPNDYAARMIDECGLKGCSVGGAAVSEKHAGFIVNRGGASAKDVVALSELVRKAVMERFGVTLQYEIQYVE